MSRPEDKAHRAVTARIARLGLSVHPGLLFQIGLEGYRNYAFGARSGPTIDARNIFHELAHAAEFGPETFEQRCTPYGYRFNISEVWVFDRYCVESKTMQAVWRELRTFSYQFHLMSRAGYRLDPERFSADHAPLMRFMPDWDRVPGKSEEARIAYCAKQTLFCIGQLNSEEAYARLVGWLDRTAIRLQGLAIDTDSDAREPEPRYRADGSTYCIH